MNKRWDDLPLFEGKYIMLQGTKKIGQQTLLNENSSFMEDLVERRSDRDRELKNKVDRNFI